MGNPVVHVEVTGKDGAKLQKFYEDVFGWKLDTSNPGGYGMLRGEGQTITGGIGDAPRPHRRREGHPRQDRDAWRPGAHAADPGRAGDDDRAVRGPGGSRHRLDVASRTPEVGSTPPSGGS